MKKLIALISIICIALSLPADGAAQRRTSQSVNREKQEASKRVKQTQQEIAANNQRIRNRIDELNGLEAQIMANSTKISKLEGEMRKIERRIKAVNDTIDLLEQDITRIKDSSRQSLRDSRKRRQSMSAMAMIFSAESFSQAVKRASYLEQLDKSRVKKARALKAKISSLDVKKAELATLKKKNADNLASIAKQQEQLKSDQEAAEKLVAALRKDGRALERELSERQKKVRELDQELDRIIAEEMRIAEEQEQQRLAAERQKQEEEARLLAEQKAKEEAAAAANNDAKKSKKENKKDKKKKKETKPAKEIAQTPGDVAAAAPSPTKEPAQKTTPAKPEAKELAFADAKGKLPQPVSGSSKIVGVFGRSRHTDLSRVEIDNPGIDILTSQGSNALAVFPGTVSSIFHLDGYHNIVMVRHGEYLTVYANIDKLAVKKGDKVQAGQSLGSIYADKADNNRTVLHFEVRKEREKLNPAEWLKQ